jgi:ParB family transcriptional regulator, chromosome partitioning protein
MSLEQIQEVAIDRLKAAPQIRKNFDPRIIAAIAASLLECGQLQPLRVRQLGNDFVIVDGELRYRAGKIAQFKTMKVIVEAKDLGEAEIVLRQLVADCHRSNLNDIEEANAFDSLMKQMEWNVSQTAAKLGFSVGKITKSLTLLTLSKRLQQRVCDGEIPASAAYSLTRVQDASEQEKLAARVVSGELTRDGLISAIKATKRGRRRPQKPRPMQVTAKLENSAKVSISAPNLDLNSFVQILEKLLNHAQQAQNEGLALDALLKRVAGKHVAVVASTEAA